MKTFAERIHAQRTRLRAGLADFAGLCGSTQTTVWNWENGFQEPKRLRQSEILTRLAAVKARDVKPCRMGRPRKAKVAK